MPFDSSEYYCLESNEVFEDAGKSRKDKIDKEKKVIKENNDHEILKQYLNVIENNNQPTTVEGKLHAVKFLS